MQQPIQPIQPAWQMVLKSPVSVSAKIISFSSTTRFTQGRFKDTVEDLVLTQPTDRFR